jgi:peptidoglycan hydrolase-like protein with peptidoglycan-binding domain
MATNAPLGLHAKGPDVETVQSQLKKIGIPVPRKEADGGTFGAGTGSAVRAFEAGAGLPRMAMTSE